MDIKSISPILKQVQDRDKESNSKKKRRFQKIRTAIGKRKKPEKK